MSLYPHMRRLLLVLVFLTSAAVAEQFVEHGGRKILSFDVPQVQYRGKREGKFTRIFFSNPVEDGNLKITIKAKGWMGELKAEQRYQSDKRDKRRSQHHRLHKEPEIPGAMRTLTYSTSSPYIGQALVIYTKDFRCEFLVTGTEKAAKQVEPTYQQLLKTLKVIPRTKIGELKIGE